MTTAAVATTTTQNQGPVAQPAATETGQTTYVYTTTDADGDTTVIQAIFTPSFIESTVLPSETFTGTVLGYSQWLSIIGTNTVAANDVASGAGSIGIFRERWPWTAAAGALIGAVGGAWLVLL